MLRLFDDNPGANTWTEGGGGGGVHGDTGAQGGMGIHGQRGGAWRYRGTGGMGIHGQRGAWGYMDRGGHEREQTNAIQCGM